MKGLDRIKTALKGASDEQLGEEIADLVEQRRAFARANQHFKERAHTAVDASIEATRAELDRLLAKYAGLQGPIGVHGGDSPVTTTAALWATSQPAFARAWHDAVDAYPGFSPLSLGEFEAALAKLDRSIAERRTELTRRAVAAAQAEATAELARLEESLTT